MSELTLEQRVFRNEAYRDIQNVMGKYVFYRMYDMLEETARLFSSRPDTTVEMPWGVYKVLSASTNSTRSKASS